MMGKGLKLGRRNGMHENRARVGCSRMSLEGQLGCGFGHLQKSGGQTDSPGVRLVSKRQAETEKRFATDLEHDALFGSRWDKVRQVTLPRFSWTDEKGWPK